MFKKSKKQISIKLLITNMKLIDMPPNQNRVFVKIKQGKSNVTTRSFPIVKNQVIFREPVDFDYNTSVTFHYQKKKNIRFSFRYELANGSGFTRYGTVEINPIHIAKERGGNVNSLLENCSYNTYFSCLIIFSDDAFGVNFKSNLMCIPEQTNDVSNDENQKSNETSEQSYSSTIQQGSNMFQKAETISFSRRNELGSFDVSHLRSKSLNNEFIDQKDYLMDFVPSFVSEQRYLELEKQIDDLLVDVCMKFTQN